MKHMAPTLWILTLLGSPYSQIQWGIGKTWWRDTEGLRTGLGLGGQAVRARIPLCSQACSPCPAKASLPSAATWCSSAVKLKGMQLLPSSLLVCAACWWHYTLHCLLAMQVGCGSLWPPQKPCNSLMALYTKPQCCNGDFPPNHWPSQLLLQLRWCVPCLLQ